MNLSVSDGKNQYVLTPSGIHLLSLPVEPVSSAGVFDSTGLLVRTLWSAVTDAPHLGNPVAAWDGTLDDGTVAPTGTYIIQSLSNSVSYTWEGVVGNSGAQPHTNNYYQMELTGLGVPINSINFHTHGGLPQGIAITSGGEIYMSTQYDERIHIANVSTTADPQTNNTILGQGFRGTWSFQNCQVCTDGTIAYYGWQSAYNFGKSTMVWGIVTATKAPAVFPSGRDESGDVTIEGGTVWGIGDYTDAGDGSAFITGIAVQQTGFGDSILALSRSAIDTIFTCNKTTGASLQTFTDLHLPERLGCDPATGDFWVIHQLVTVTVPAFAAINLRIQQGSSVTAKLTAASFTYTAPVGYAALNGTLDPVTLHGGITLSGGNLTAANPSSGTSDDNYIYSQNSVAKGYFEIVINADALNLIDNGIIIGIAGTTSGRTTFSLGDDTQSIGWANSNQGFGQVVGPNAAFRGTMQFVGYTTGDNVGVAFDTTRSKIWWRKNGGDWNNFATGDPAALTNGLDLQTVASPTLVPKVSKLTCDAFGTLTDTGTVINGLSSPVDVAVSPDGSMVLVVDAGMSQQVKAFNTSDGSVKTAWGSSGKLGTLDGYASSPTVTNTKFMFSTPDGQIAGSAPIAFAPDGSFWFQDVGNWRTLHFSAGNSPTYIEQVKYDTLSSGSCWVHWNDDTRVYSGFLEYKIDYSKPLDGGTNGSWVLVNNWYYGLPAGVVSQGSQMRYAGTYSNGRSYCPVYDGSTFHFMEMTTSGWRDTGVTSPQVYVDRGFNLWQISQVNPGSSVVYKKNALTGFDGSGNPTYAVDPTSGTYATILTSQVLPANFPPTGNFNNIPSYMVEPLANGVIPVYNQDGTSSGASLGNHVGGIDSSTGLVKFSTHPSSGKLRGGGPGTAFQYYVEAPYFDNATFNSYGITNTGVGGVGPNMGGAIWYKPGAVDFFTGYPGEDWGNNQTNVWSHWHQTGLMIGRFGVAAPYFGHAMFMDGTFTHDNGANFYRVPLSPPAITIAAWVKPSVLDANLRNIWQTRSNQGGFYNAILGVINTNAAFYYNNAHNITAGSLVVGTWYRVVATVDANGAVLYVNGTQVGTGAGATLPTTNLANVNIGNNDGAVGPIIGTVPFFGGDIADVAVWNVALSPTQVTSLQTQRANAIGANANLVGYWPVTGDRFELDYSGNNNDTFAGLPVVAGPPGFPLFNGVNNALTFNGTSDGLLLDRNIPDPLLGGSSFRAMPGCGGNSKWGGLAFQNDKYFIYHNNEWYSGGKDRWSVDNLNSIHLGQPIAVNWNSASYVAPVAGLPDLLATLPYDQPNLPNNSAGWVRSPTADTSTPLWHVYTNAIVANTHSSPDLVFTGNNSDPAGMNSTLSRTWVRSGSGDWSMDAIVALAGSGNVDGNGKVSTIYIDILDAMGKVIVRMQNGPILAGQGFLVNGSLITPAFDPTTGVWPNYSQGTPRPLTVSANVGGGTMLVTFGDFNATVGVSDVTANIATPSQFRLTWFADATAQAIDLGVCFTKLMFIE